MKKHTSSLIVLLLFVAVVVLVNMLAQRYKFRLDLTGEKRYTLSPTTGCPMALRCTRI